MPDNASSTRDFMEQIKQAPDEELHGRKRQITESLFNLRFRLASGQVEDPKRLRKYKKGIARINTVLHAREMARQRGDE
ncbi:MAG TPA: 50S ribosomal protein L29 [Armatimonadota bacterium]